MVQSRASVQGDVPELVDAPMGGSVLFVEVENLDGVASALDGVEPVVPRRTSFYGADELIEREPADAGALYAGSSACAAPSRIRSSRGNW